MTGYLAQDSGIPRTKYRRVGIFSALSRPPLVDQRRKQVMIYFPLSPRLAYLIGAVFGDGTVTARRLTYFNLDRQWLKKVSGELHLLTSSRRRKPRILPPRGRSVPSLEYGNSALARLIGGHASARLRLLPILTRTRVLLAAFTAGIFDSEGSATIYLNKRHPKGAVEVSIANSNLKMLRFLQAKLLELGIGGGISLSAGPRRSLIKGERVKGKKRVYRLRFSGWSSATKFARFILPLVKSLSKGCRLKSINRRRFQRWGR